MIQFYFYKPTIYEKIYFAKIKSLFTNSNEVNTNL